MSPFGAMRPSPSRDHFRDEKLTLTARLTSQDADRFTATCLSQEVIHEAIPQHHLPKAPEHVSSELLHKEKSQRERQ